MYDVYFGTNTTEYRVIQPPVVLNPDITKDIPNLRLDK